MHATSQEWNKVHVKLTKANTNFKADKDLPWTGMVIGIYAEKSKHCLLDL
jgi:hypothetical protein